MDITGVGMQIFLGVSLANFTCAVVTYVVLGGYKIRRAPGASDKKIEKFDGKQLLSLAAILVMVVLVVGFSFDVGLVCLTLALILILLGAADEKKAIKMIPWSTLLLIGGVSVLMNITQTLGGIQLLSDILASFMNSRTAAPLMGLTGGIMSWFSSANGVVFPTLIPTVSQHRFTGRRSLHCPDDGGHRLQRYRSGHQPSVYGRKPGYGRLCSGDGM